MSLFEAYMLARLRIEDFHMEAERKRLAAIAVAGASRKKRSRRRPIGLSLASLKERSFSRHRRQSVCATCCC